MAQPIQKVIRTTPVADPIASAKPNATEDLQLLLEELHESGILEAARSLIAAKESATKIAVEQMVRGEVVTAINNVMAIGAVLTKVDTNHFSQLAEGLKAGFVQGEKAVKKNKKVGLFHLSKALKDPDVNRAIRYGLGFLQGLGKHLPEEE